MTRVLHTADTHVGYRQYHSDERRRDFLQAFEHVVDDAIDVGVDAVVHAGDLFHDKRPDLRDLQGAIAALARLRAAGIPFLGIVGNHERKRDAQWLDLFADLDLATRLTTAPTMVGDVAIYGLDYRTPTRRDADAVAFEATPPEADTAALVGHGIVDGLPFGDWALEPVLQAASVDFDAALLGDHHEHVLERRAGTVVTYPGSTERASADETGPRGYNLVTFDDDVTVSHRTLAATRPFVFVDVTLAADEGIDRVRDRLDEHDLSGAVAIVSIDGDGEAVPTGTVESHALDAGAIVARVTDRRDRTDPDEEGVSVSFADPDRAVEAALHERSLSAAARRLDDVIRDLDVADSNLREVAHDRIGALLEEDPEALARPATPPAQPQGDGPEEAPTEPAGDGPTEEGDAADGDDQAAVTDYL